MTDQHFARTPQSRARAAIGLLTMSLAVIGHASPTNTLAAQSSWILEQLARPASASTPFVELRGSPLLKAPLRISGQYQQPRQGVLVRQVMAPYVETTTITPEQVTIARDGQRARTVAVSRVPQLAGLQTSFGALLAGDRAQLEQYYQMDAGGTREHWTLVLTPRQDAMASKVQAITLRGRGDELRCIETKPAGNSEVQRTLLAGAAVGALTVGGDELALAALC